MFRRKRGYLFRGPQLDAIEARTFRQDITEDDQLIAAIRRHIADLSGRAVDVA